MEVIECWSEVARASSFAHPLKFASGDACATIMFAAEEFHDIAPPVDYSLIPSWLVFVLAFVVLSMLGLLVWWFVQRRKTDLPPKVPREIALGVLEQIRGQTAKVSPSQCSIRLP